MNEYCKGVHRIGEGCNLYKTCSYPNCREDSHDKNYKKMKHTTIYPLPYNGYKCVIEYSDVDGVYWGKLLDVGSDLVLFDSKTLIGIDKAFKETVDDYIETKKQLK